MARLTFGLLSVICVVAFSAAVKGKSYVREKDPYSRASSLFRFGNSFGYGRDISDWMYPEDYDDFSSSESDETTSEIIKSSNESTPIHLKDEDYPDSSEGEYIELSSKAQSTENVSTTMHTSEDNAVASTTPQPLNTSLEKEKGSSTTTEKIHVISSSSPIGNYSKEDEVSFVSTPTTSEVTSYGAQGISPNSTLYNSTSTTESFSSTQVRSTNSSKKLPYTVTPDDHKNITVSSIKILATRDDSNASSIVSVSSLDDSTNSPSVTSMKNTDERISGETYTTMSAIISVTNAEETKGDETYTTVSPQLTYSQSSSIRTKSSSTQLVNKTTKLAELTTATEEGKLAIATEEEKSDVITEAISSVSEAAKNRSLKLVVSVVFLIIALISMAVLITYVIRTKRMDVQYDELTLLP
ncbi:hypothetical protein X975_08910, partial [Stegodyphus mimosarum]